MKNTIGSMLVPSGCSQEEVEQMNEEIPSEVANIVVGLSLQELTGIDISTPKLLDSCECKNSLNFTENSLVKEIKTPKGSISFTIIKN
jgi:chemotaxis protein CheY-P-specific phosphatase CheC